MPSSNRTKTAATSPWERRLIQSARDGAPVAQRELLELYRPMLRSITARLYLPGGEREDLLQELSLALFEAATLWDSGRNVPFRNFAWLCVSARASRCLEAANAGKHRVLNHALTLDWQPPGHSIDGPDVPGAAAHASNAFEPRASIDTEPERKALAREDLRRVIARLCTLSPLERRALAGAANDRTHRELAVELGVRPRGVNNALQRARRKLDVGSY